MNRQNVRGLVAQATDGQKVVQRVGLLPVFEIDIASGSGATPLFPYPLAALGYLFGPGGSGHNGSSAGGSNPYGGGAGGGAAIIFYELLGPHISIAYSCGTRGTAQAAANSNGFDATDTTATLYGRTYRAGGGKKGSLPTGGSGGIASGCEGGVLLARNGSPGSNGTFFGGNGGDAAGFGDISNVFAAGTGSPGSTGPSPDAGNYGGGSGGSPGSGTGFGGLGRVIIRLYRFF